MICFTPEISFSIRLKPCIGAERVGVKAATLHDVPHQDKNDQNNIQRIAVLGACQGNLSRFVLQAKLRR